MGNWENSGGFYTAIIRPLYGHYTALIRPLYGRCTALMRPLYGPYMQVHRHRQQPLLLGMIMTLRSHGRVSFDCGGF